MSRFVFQNPYGLRHLECLKWRGLNDRDDRCSPAAVKSRELITSRLERACVPGSMVAYYRNSIASAHLQWMQVVYLHSRMTFHSCWVWTEARYLGSLLHFQWPSALRRRHVRADS